MNARRRWVLRIRDGHWLAAAGFLAIVCLFGCGPDNTGNGDPVPQPRHTTHVTTRPTRPPVNPTHQAAPRGDNPAGVLCHDATVVTTEPQCTNHGGVAEG